MSMPPERAARLANDAKNNWIRQPLPDMTISADGKLYANVDFRNVSTEAGGDANYRICLAQLDKYIVAVEIFVSGRELSLHNGDKIEPLCEIKTGTWYNLQLAVDVAGKKYSGVLSGDGQKREFADKSFPPGWSAKIDQIWIDSPDEKLGVRPAHDIDNVLVRATPIDPAGVGPEATKAPQEPLVTEAIAAKRTELSAARGRLAALQGELDAARKQKDELDKNVPYETAFGAGEGKITNVRVQLRGEPLRLGAEVPRRFLEILGGDVVPADGGSGRRQLAEWIVRPTNPLTPRVIANRLWHYHFGKGLVQTTSDFGVRGRKPTHPELLDYLSARLIENGWSLKAMHREILLSHTYQMAGTPQPEAIAVDPSNESLWRFERAA